MSNSAGVVVERVGADQLRARRQQILDLHRACYAPAPWNLSADEIAGYEGALDRHLNIPGLEAVTAVEGEALVGVAYGFPGPERLPDDDGGFYGSVVEALGRRAAEGLVSGRPFEVAQVMVGRDVQGRGVGRAVFDLLVADKPRAWLVTLPGSPASRLYAAAGWQRLAPRISLRGRENEIWAFP